MRRFEVCLVTLLWGRIPKLVQQEGYISVKELAEQWDVTMKYVQTLCRQGSIKGVIKNRGKWLIPADAERPNDNRVKSGKYIGWRKKYHVGEKLDTHLMQMVEDVRDNAEKHKKVKTEKKIKFYVSGSKASEQ